ncbi:uncharacterized protein LOC124423734 isoform X1 [Vespa crabro]|nr:uncharacterized protein LOC124423734 isoform X1 [Vespa crabro]
MSLEDWMEKEILCYALEENMINTIQEDMFPYVSEEVEVRTSKDIEDEVKNKGHNVRPLQPSDSYNGAIRDTYIWSQTITDIDVLVKLPKLSLKVKDLRVNIETQRIKIEAIQRYKTSNESIKEPEWTTIFKGELIFKTKKDESVWSLISGYVSIHLEKVSERWWDALIMEEPKIELNKIDCSRNLYEMGLTEQMKVEELMWNHQQKLLGKPTSEQLKMEEIMKKAWNAEGSPFQERREDKEDIKMPCSAVTLSLATITGIIATALLAIAFSTDNWLYTEVKRAQIQQYAGKHAEQSHLIDQMNAKYYYYTRTQGLFRICYPKERPPTVETYLSPVETHCMNIDYFIPDEENQTRDFSDDAMARLHMGRSVIALFMVGFLAIFSAFWTGVVGCWRRSPGNITATAILMLFACLLSAGGMGLWHGVEYYEKEKIVGEEYYQQWSNVLKDNSLISYDWSYVVAWVGVGWSLISAILFSAAAICLRGERMREEAMNMQYLMPVYPQKQQYAYAGYPAPAAYPGPYYHGSQYGPYNY